MSEARPISHHHPGLHLIFFHASAHSTPRAPAADAPTPEPLRTLRSTYRASLSQLITQLITQRDQRLQPLHEKYLQALQTYQDELTRAQNLDAALTVKKFRDTEAAAGGGKQ